jgi:hypothetical protein
MVTGLGLPNGGADDEEQACSNHGTEQDRQGPPLQRDCRAWRDSRPVRTCCWPILVASNGINHTPYAITVDSSSCRRLWIQEHVDPPRPTPSAHYALRQNPSHIIQDGVRCRIDAGGFRGPFQEPWTCLWPCRMIVCRSRRAWVKTKSMMLYAFWRVRCVRHGVRVPTLILNTAGGDEADWRLFYIGRADEC